MNASILVVAGEISGDLHASKVVKAYRQKNPETEFWGIGGDRLAAEGVELLQHTDRMGVMGIVEVLKQYRFFKQVLQQTLDEVDRRRPKAALLVDYPGFNLRLAKELKKRGVAVYYYISPKVWAWNKKRIPKMAKVIDRLMVIFPFEVALFEGSGLPTDFVGNPLVEQIDDFMKTEPRSLPWGSDCRVALLPGSRRQEILRILPTILTAAYELEKQFPEVSFMIASPNERVMGLVKEQISRCEQKPSRLEVVCDGAREVMRQATAAMVTSGTATLETALIGTPHILVYKTSAFTYWFARSVVKVRHIGLVNIIAGRTVCPELIQSAATPLALAQKTGALMINSADKREMLTDYCALRAQLGARRAAERVAGILAE